MRVAIVGFGPKGLFALERLLDHASLLEPDARLEVDLYEPHPSPAAGPNYDPGLPGYLRMNFAAELVDMWWPGGQAVPEEARPSFAVWRARAGLIDDGTYPPRGEVGRYLSEGFEALLRHAPRGVTVRLSETAVGKLSPSAGGWAIAGSHYDEVLVATGHVQGSPFPVEHWLSLERVPAGSTVAIRGFALTFLDAALALTEGRGAGAAVSQILPYSRTGRPLLAKPLPGLAASIAGLATIGARGRAALEALVAPARLRRDVLPILARAVDESLAAAASPSQGDAVSWLAAAVSGAPLASGLAPAAELARSLAVGSGREAPGLTWALGHCWRSLYPAIVARLGGEGLFSEDWPAFHRLAGELERVAFGPSPTNARKLLELVEAGTVDLSFVAGGHVVEHAGRRTLRLDGLERPADVLVDAVLPGPGVLPGRGSPAAQLVADGHARILPHRRGLDVTDDGSCRGRAGTPTPGLAAIGRPTEDSVIGNDTLSRTLHPLSDLWARRVVTRCRAEACVADTVGV